jgi:hypothetical protein
MCKGALPLDRSGTIALPKLPERELVTKFLGYHQIGEDILSEHFSALFQQLLTSFASQNYDGLEKVVEKRFLAHLRSKSSDLGKFDLQFTPADLEKTAKSSYMIDQVLVKGVKFDRHLNDLNHDYMYVDSHVNQGLRFYLHKYFLGFHPYYMEIENQEFYDKLKNETEEQRDKKPMLDVMLSQDEQRDIFFRQRKNML